jgi:hypothetical protein
MTQLAWRFLMFQKDSALAQWFRSRTARYSQAHDRVGSNGGWPRSPS